MNERMEANIVDFSAYRTRKEVESKLTDAFADLPIAEGVSLANFCSTLDVASLDMLKQKVTGRYEILRIKRESAGIDGQLILDNETLISILDDKLHDELTKEIDDDVKIISVGRHEGGHAVVAGVLGWHVKSLTVVPNGYYLGLTESVPRAGLRFDEWLLESAAISFGGKIAAIMSGDEPSGIGADMASVAAKARMAVLVPGSRFVSEEAFMREAEGLAHMAISRVGIAGLNEIANRAYEKGTIAA